VGPRAGVDVCKKFRPHRDLFSRSPDRPARSQSLYRLIYRTHIKCIKENQIHFQYADVIFWHYGNKRVSTTLVAILRVISLRTRIVIII
jgi:hypothetical protein